MAPGSEDQWAEVRVSLEAYLGQPLYIAFRYEGDFASEWYVDDVAVTTPLIALNDSPTIIGTTTQLTAAIGSGTNVSVTWDFGDGTSGEGLMPAHRYALPGTYTATVTARNTVSARSAETVIVVEGRTYSQHLPLVVNNYVPPCLDAYEPDDSQSLARSIATDGAAQEHSFHIPGDEDWVSFSVDDPAAVYVIETFDLQNTDTVIYLFDTDGETLLDWNDDAGPTDRSSRLTFRPYQTGVFTLRIVDYYPTAGGCDHLYHVRVTR